MGVAQSSVLRPLRLILLLAMWVLTTASSCLTRESTVDVWVVGIGEVDFNSDTSGRCPDVDADGISTGGYCSFSSGGNGDFTLSAVGSPFDHWVCYRLGTAEIKTERELAFQTGLPGTGGHIDCLALFGARQVTFEIEQDPSDLFASVTVTPGSPQDAACQDDQGLLVPGGLPCTCRSSCVLFVKDQTVVTASPNTPGTDLTIVDGNCPGLSFTANADDLECHLRLKQPRLSIHITGNGKVTSGPSGIDCQGTIRSSLTPVPAPMSSR